MEVRIGKIIIGSKYPCCVVGEMSGNHGGKINRALKIIHAVKKAGANAVKLQTYTPDSITLKSNRKDFIISQDTHGLKKKIYGIYINLHILQLNGTKNYFRKLKKLN